MKTIYSLLLCLSIFVWITACPDIQAIDYQESWIIPGNSTVHAEAKTERRGYSGNLDVSAKYTLTPVSGVGAYAELETPVTSTDSHHKTDISHPAGGTFETYDKIDMYWSLRYYLISGYQHDDDRAMFYVGGFPSIRIILNPDSLTADPTVAQAVQGHIEIPHLRQIPTIVSLQISRISEDVTARLSASNVTIPVGSRLSELFDIDISAELPGGGGPGIGGSCPKSVTVKAESQIADQVITKTKKICINR